EAVELADEGEARAGGVALEAALDPGQGEPSLRVETDLPHRVGDQRGSPAFVEAGLGVVQDPLAQFDDLVAVAVDRLAHRLLQFVLAGHRCPRLCGCRQSRIPMPGLVPRLSDSA